MSESEAEGQDPATRAELQQTAGQTQESRPSAEDEGNQMKSRDEVGVRKVEPKPDKLKMTGRSQVYTSTKETLFLNNRTHPSTHALSPVWVFGKNPALPVFNLLDHDQMVFLFAAANVGVLYNHTTNSQHILRGHSQSISCMCVSEDRRWIATGDNGSKGLVIIWDFYSGIPVHTFFDCHGVGGLTALAFSSDTKHLATVSGEEVQCVCIWDWSNKAEKLLSCTELHPKYGLQDYITFKPNDSTQLLSSSKNHMIFYSTAKGSLQYFALNIKKLVGSSVFSRPSPLLPKRVPLADVSLSRSVFHCTESQVLMAVGGILVMMNVSEDLVEHQSLPLRKIKKINHQQDPITALTMMDGCGVIGNIKGQIKFFDENFKFLRWFVDLSLDPIVFISFSKECADEFVEDLSLEAKPFILRNFTVLTISSKVVHVNAQRNFSQTLLHEDSEPLYAVACHPSQPTVVMGSQQGVLQMWDYNKKVPIGDKVFMTEKGIHCVTFDPEGSYLAVGFGSGVVIILNYHTLQCDPEEFFHCTTDSIHLITFSADSQYLAAADTGNAVTVFRLRQEGSLSRWTYLGRYGSHYKPIKDLLFGVQLDSNQPRLLSLGMDRKLVEYDLKNSSVNELVILNSEQIEQSATPLCMTWYPPITTEHFLLITSDQYKMKLFNSTTKMCRQTVLGPVLGSPIKRIVVLPKLDESEVKSHHFAYVTEDKLGLQILPLDGNPHKSTAFICHPTGPTALACSYDGRFVCTAGGSDCSVILWEINLIALEAAAALGGKDMEPFYNLLEGGANGRGYKEIEDYFYYCQIIDQGHSSKRQPSTKIPLSQVPFLMRALGYFPSEKEINDMQNEIKFSKYAETRKYVSEIGIEDFVKLYINHRPTDASSSRELLQAFHVLGESGSTGQPVLLKSELTTLLKGQGEHMTEKEVAECFTTLLNLNEEEEEEIEGAHCADSEYSLECVIPDELSVKTLTQLLGFPFLEETSGRSPPPE